jgi:hypothetical protein
MACYLAEFDLRYSTKDKSDTERAGDILKGMEGRRLTDRRTAALAVRPIIIPPLSCKSGAHGERWNK